MYRDRERERERKKEREREAGRHRHSYIAIDADITVCACGRWIVTHTPENDVLLRVPVLPIMSNGCESCIGTGS